MTALTLADTEVSFSSPPQKAIVGVWRDGCWELAMIHADGHVTRHVGRPGQGPHSTFRETARKAEYELELLLNAGTAHDLAASVAQMTQGDSE